jgi:hypothetical protein
MPIQLIVALLIAAGGFGSAWKIQSWRMDAMEGEYVKQALADQRSASTAAIRRQEVVITAQAAANSYAVVLRRDADSARTALVGLSHATEQALRDATTSHSACLERATAIADVQQQSTERYRSLGETCDRHVNDLKTLTSAWPKP